jgi:tetratricopeptide (TPR) repeat protein
VGTPMYMAPEQRSAQAPDARADQFSFCVALYWALFGTWPFDRYRSYVRADDHSPGSSHKGTSRPSQRSDDARPIDPASGAFEPPRDSNVPAFVRRAILRGLSPAPEDRFPSMDALLAQLEDRPRRLRMAAGAAALALVAAVGAYSTHAHQVSQRQTLLCTGAEQKLTGLWDDTIRRQVTEALVATGKPEAADVASRVTRLLDAYTRDWVETSTEACRATRIRGEQTEQLLSLRVVCLERRLQLAERALGMEHVRRANILANIGNLHRKQGRFEEASKALGEALALRERLSGPRHPIAGTIHYSLAQALRLHDFEQARTHARRALEIDIATFGPEHPQVGGSYDVVGHVSLEEEPRQGRRGPGLLGQRPRAVLPRAGRARARPVAL